MNSCTITPWYIMFIMRKKENNVVERYLDKFQFVPVNINSEKAVNNREEEKKSRGTKNKHDNVICSHKSLQNLQRK